MTRPFVNCLHLDDYDDIQVGVRMAKDVTSYFQTKGCRIEIPVEWRWWEYGSAMQLLLNLGLANKPQIRILNVGAGWDGLGPTVAMEGFDVTECEPDLQCRQDREKVNEVLIKDDKAPILILPNGLDSLPEEEYDAVFCISVLEHVQNENTAWKQLASRVTPGGLLFVTVDCVQYPNRPYQNDGARVTNYTPEILKDRVDMVIREGFAAIGNPEYTWNGRFVWDYTFFRAGLVRDGGMTSEDLLSNNMARQVRRGRVRPKLDPVLSAA